MFFFLCDPSKGYVLLKKKVFGYLFSMCHIYVELYIMERNKSAQGELRLINILVSHWIGVVTSVFRFINSFGLFAGGMSRQAEELVWMPVELCYKSFNIYQDCC